MPRRRRTFKRSRPLKTMKYENETKSIGATIPIEANSFTPTKIIICQNTDVQGVRKVKNFYLEMAFHSDAIGYYALIYEPAGQQANTLIQAGPNQAVDIFQPNQNIIFAGTILDSGSDIKRKTRLSRNLNSGDSIVLIIYLMNPTAAAINIVTQGVINYSICYN